MDSTQNFAPIAALDLDPIKVKLMHKESGEGWSLAHANAMEFEYRRFLYLMKLFPHEQTAPLFDVDIFWHYHILDTMKYAADCEQIFGYFLHHFPYVGLRGEDDEICHERSGARMQELYEATFGEAYIRQSDGNAVTERRPQASAEAPWSTGVALTTAYCTSAVMGKAAYCAQAVMGDTAYCTSAVMAKTAYCSQAAKTAYCSQAVTAKTAYSAGVPLVSTSSLTGAQQDRVFNPARPRLA